MRRNPKIVSLSPPMQATAGMTPNHGFALEDAWGEMDEELTAFFGDNFDTFEASWIGTGTYAAVFAIDDDTVLKLTTDEDDARASQVVASGKVRVPRGLPRPTVVDGAVDGLVRIYGVSEVGVVHEDVGPMAVARRGVDEREAMLYAIIAERTVAERGDPRLDTRVFRDISHARLAFLAAIDTHHSADQVARDRRLTDEQRRLFDAMVNGFRFLAYNGIHVRDFHANNWGWSAARKQSVLIDLGHHASLAGGSDDVEENPYRPAPGKSAFDPQNRVVTIKRYGVDASGEYVEVQVAGPYGAHVRLPLSAIRRIPPSDVERNPETGGSFGGHVWSNPGKMPRVRRAFEQVFALVKERFPDFGSIELHQDEKAGADNGVGADRQFGYCMSGDPQVIAFAAKTEKLPEANILGLMAHEFGHALDNRYGKKLPGMLGVRLPAGAELRADAIAKAAFGATIKYDARDVQCIGCRGTSPRPRRLGS